jgi:hypothetical protein
MASKPMSGWWPISLGIATLVFFIAGGALLGTWAGCYWDCSVGGYYGGIALIVIAVLLKLAWIVVLIIYIRNRRTGYGGMASANAKVHWNAGTGLLDGRNFSSSQPPPPTQYSFAPPVQTQYSAVPVAAPRYDEIPAKDHAVYGAAELPQQHAPSNIRYCLQCGAPVQTPFCAHCGSSNPM